MKRALIGTAATLTLLVATPAFAQDRCEYGRDVDETVDASGASLATIIAESGSLRVEGRDGAAQVRVTGRACASSQDWLDDMSLSAGRSGDRVRVETEIPDRWNWTGGRYAYIDLVIEVPSELELDIEDGSGGMMLVGIGPATIEDGSGEIEIENARGDLLIDDGSGSIVIDGVAGEVRLVDGSGEIRIRGAESVHIEDDGSGGMTIEDIAGSVMIDEDGSGGITVRDVGGDLTVQRDGSGGIRHTGVQGNVDIPRRGRRS